MTLPVENANYLLSHVLATHDMPSTRLTDAETQKRLSEPRSGSADNLERHCQFLLYQRERRSNATLHRQIQWCSRCSLLWLPPYNNWRPLNETCPPLLHSVQNNGLRKLKPFSVVPSFLTQGYGSARLSGHGYQLQNIKVGGKPSINVFAENNRPEPVHNTIRLGSGENVSGCVVW